MWLKGPNNDGYYDKHFCELPSLDGYNLLDHKRVTKWRWVCPVCGRGYRPGETEMGLGPMYEWVRLMPWSEWYWQRRSGIVF